MGKKMGKFLKQAAAMQQKWDQVQEEISDSIIEVEASGGAIKMEITGDSILHSLKIDPEIIDPEDAEGLEDLILTAVNQAIKEAKEYSEEKTAPLSEGLNLPGGLGL